MFSSRIKTSSIFFFSGVAQAVKLLGMKILALETGGTASPREAILAAIELSNVDAQVAALVSIEQPRALGAQLVGAIDETLSEAGWNGLDDLDGLAIGRGPGSWTSLRVGFATFKTLAQTRGLPLAAVPSFDALASAIHRSRPAQNSSKSGKRRKKREVESAPQIVLALSPCRPGALYGKLFQMTDEYLAPVQAEWIAPAQMHLDSAFCQALASEIYGPLLICGAAGMEAVELLEARGETDLYEYIEAPAATVAIEIGIAGAYQIADEEVPELGELEPLYLAPSAAERNLKV